MRPELDAVEARVLGALVEKEITTPEYYPLTLNALVNACNQKSNREPVVSYDDDTVADALASLREKKLSFSLTGAGMRVPKYGHRMVETMNLGRREVAILCELLNRGPQTVGELRKLLDDADGAIDVSLSDTKIQFGFNGVELTSKLIDGNFPPYERVIPSGNDKSLALEAKEFAQSVDRVSTISADKTRAVKLNLSKDKVTLSVVNPESGTATEDVGATYSAGALEIGFNARYLLDITSQIEGKEVRFLLSDAGSPAIIEDAEDARTLYVLMPLRV